MKKLTSLVLVMVMLLTMLPLGALNVAAAATTYTEGDFK